jgi:RNA polymerase sigma-70 factor (ECF subfamily)
LLTPQPPTPTIDNDLIVRLIQVGDPRGEQLLYENYSRGLRFLAARHSPDHAENCLHDTVLIAIRQIRQGQLDSPAALPGYLNIILKRAAWNKNMAAKRRVGDEETLQAVVQTRADDRADPQRQLEI